MLLRVPSLPGELWGPAEVGGEDCRIVCSGGEVRDILDPRLTSIILTIFRLLHTAQSLQELLNSWPPSSSHQEHAIAPLLA